MFIQTLMSGTNNDYNMSDNYYCLTYVIGATLGFVNDNYD